MFFVGFFKNFFFLLFVFYMDFVCFLFLIMFIVLWFFVGGFMDSKIIVFKTWHFIKINCICLKK